MVSGNKMVSGNEMLSAEIWCNELDGVWSLMVCVGRWYLFEGVNLLYLFEGVRMSSQLSIFCVL